jgi:hypothetical protein
MKAKGLPPPTLRTTDWTHQTISKKIVNQMFYENPNVDQYQLSGNLSWETDGQYV